MKDEHVIYLVGAVGFLLGIVLTVIASSMSHKN